MSTQLLEFPNKSQALLRGLLVTNQNADEKYAVLMLGGFERSGTTERKFKTLANKLAEKKVASFRFDATDCGLSDGDFYNMTTETLAEDLMGAVDLLKSRGYDKFSVVGHSLAACAISLLLDKVDFEKIVLISPALNQKDLLRLWFAQQSNKDVKVNWDNYRNYFKEEDFLGDLKSDMTTKSHRLNFKYRYENRDRDYSSEYEKIPAGKILSVLGDKDDKVPAESLNFEFKNNIIARGGDHDLEKPGILEQWIDGAVDFLSRN